jgi:hypothetical protein
VSEASRCRLCGGPTASVLDLGEQVLTGRFPRTLADPVPAGRLDLHRCPGCSLVQLPEVPPLDEMYGPGYGYRSSLNASMVAHLTQKAGRLEAVAGLRPGDAVLDIGSNDGTFLQALRTAGLDRVGIDPVGALYRDRYAGMSLVPEFFTAAAWRGARPDGPSPRLITSLAMFYDLERPADFARDIAATLAPDGVWHFEQSYLPSMLQQCSYDTICHEHLEYYTLRVVDRILEEAGLRVLDVELNGVNGGSFAVTAAHRDGPRTEVAPHVAWLRRQEDALGLDTAAPYAAFAERVVAHRAALLDLIGDLRAAGRRVAAYGASTKGNVLLQYCGLGPDQVEFVIEVNPDKFGHVTPGTGIPIVSEEEGFGRRPDHLLVLPWHFRDAILRREQRFLEGGGRFVFPLPAIEVV